MGGSTILVNGTAIPTTYIDAGHLAGIVVLTQEVNSTVQLSVANPNPGASTSTAVPVSAVFASITVTASQASVAAGGTMSFSASRQGSVLTGGVWAVTGGSTNGSIDANGTYRAPATAPSPNQVSVAYTRSGASATGSVSITNPVPIATAVSPASLSTLSTPVTVSGSGFVGGSTILVNGTAIPTTYIDAGHLAGTVVLTQEVNSTVQLSVANPNPGASTSTAVPVSAVFASITVTASQASVAAGGTMSFSASRQGSVLTGGVWAVTGGSTNGSIDANGTYRAPATAPSPNQVSVAYTRSGASATGSVSITNPVPIATAVSPASLSTLSTPVTVSGSGFVGGSTILVNGTAIPTTYIDAGHLAGTVVLTQEVNSTVQLSVANPNPGASTSTAVPVSAVFASITVTASQASVAAGGTMSFSASRQGSVLTGGVWAVTGGSTNGSIDANGTYRAPATAPSPNQVSVAYTRSGASATGSVSITNPVPIATAVSPASLSTLSTPVTVSGSGFVGGSTILVNGTAIPTTYIDAGHLAGTVVLTQEVNSTVQLSVANPNPGASTSTAVPVSAVFASITVTASQASVAAGGTMSFSASRQGSVLTGGVWAVTGGSTNGSIDANGTYRAPATAPSPNQVSVAYTRSGASATGSVSITNPVPIATAVSPASLSTLSTPVTVSGSGFVGGSTILVNGTAIPTTYIDAGHLAGTVVLTQEVNSTVQLSVANPNPGASTSTAVPVSAVFASITVTASQASVAAGGTMSFSASRQGSVLTGGVWAVTGGSTNGSIDANGTYRAPATAPSPNQVSVAYTRSGASATGSVSITNPVPIATAVSPASLSTLSTPVTVSGSGFVGGSTILVNGTAIPTTYIDAGHLAGTVVLTSTANLTLQLSVSNPDPGATVSGPIQINTNFTTSSTASNASGFPISSLNTPTYFLEQSDEFVGPFLSWINVRTAFGAVGNGIADDTAALQNAINSVTDDSSSCVIWLPAGTYKISSSLMFNHMRNFTFVGEDPRTTKISWAGAPGLDVLVTDGSTYFRISRLTIEGNGIANRAATLASPTIYTDAYYSTFNELSDLRIHGTAEGLNLGLGDAETAVERVHFDHLPTAGLLVKGFNTLNIFVNDSLFSYCGTGLTDLLENGSGSFVVSNSYFDHSKVADMSIGNTGLFTARHTASVGSGQFFLSGEIYGNSSIVTLQNNTIIDPQTTPFQFGNLGPFMLIDNVVRLQGSALPMITASWAPSSTKDVFSMGNVYTPNAGSSTPGLSSFLGRLISYDDSVVSTQSIADVTVPAAVYVPPNLHRAVFEVHGTTGSAVQAAINLAAATASTGGLVKPVVHLPRGIYPVLSTITFPQGADLQLVGDDAGTTVLQWAGAGVGPTISVPTSNVSIRYIRVIGPGEGVGDGIQLAIADQPNTEVIVDQALAQLKTTYGMNFDGLEHADVELFNAYTLGSNTGVKVTGGAFRAAKKGTLGITNHYTGSLQSTGTGTSFDVSAGGKYMVQDNWHDFGQTSPQNFRLSGSGTVTEQGGAVYMSSLEPFEIDGFEGNVSLLGLQFVGRVIVAPQDGHTNLLNLGLASYTTAFLPSSVGNATVGNVLNSQINGDHLPQETTPDVAWMRSMLAQTRSEYPIARLPLKPGASRIRLNRVIVESSLSAFHFQPDRPLSGLSYVIQSGTSVLSSAGSCVGTSTNVNSSNQWLLMAAGEGDFEVVSQDTGAALGFSSSQVNSLTLMPLTGEYEQRWLISNQGDGTFVLTNRAAGMPLSLPPGGGCAQVSIGSNAAWTFIAQ